MEVNKYKCYVGDLINFRVKLTQKKVSICIFNDLTSNFGQLISIYLTNWEQTNYANVLNYFLFQESVTLLMKITLILIKLSIIIGRGQQKLYKRK